MTGLIFLMTGLVLYSLALNIEKRYSITHLSLFFIYPASLIFVTVCFASVLGWNVILSILIISVILVLLKARRTL